MSHFFICLLTTCLSSLVKHLFKYLSAFNCFVYHHIFLSCGEFAYVFMTEAFCICFAAFFLPVHGLPFHCLVVILTKPHLQLKKFL